MTITREIPSNPCKHCEDGSLPVKPTAGRILQREREEAGVPRSSVHSGYGLAERLGKTEAYVIKIEEGKYLRLTWKVVAEVRAGIAACKEAIANAPKESCACGREFLTKALLKQHERGCVMIRRIG